ncbi:hypothetical protein SAMN02745134_01538 [Clostridium acidisoli DSM 12555]|uniref:Uncharacterized protein n=1 Tax=Clostridium acidisoli DSM 12555 TaxID=1121291 RepID=A0A1W1XF00_9CLOT|nr:hypothetical protein [Clostridium acidisoli]SMC22091.1 hypothetical protein SAMN02745134_01538 [Clostridium acidisoli DSM 12555]
MKGFKKMDEMEQYIALKSLKIAYVFTIIFLVILAVIDMKNNKVNSTALFLLVVQNLILIFSQFYFKKKLGDK